MNVKVKKLTPTAVIPYKTHKDDFCYDITATSCEQISPGIYRYGTGIALEIDDPLHTYPSDLLALGLTIRPRSSIYKTGMILSNSLGTIDFGYRNEIMAVFYHVIPTLPPYKVGDRIAQIHFDVTEKIQFIHADQLSSTPRGLRGYGSTGK